MSNEEKLASLFNYITQDVKDWKEKRWLKPAIISHMQRLSISQSSYPPLAKRKIAEYVHRRFNEPS